MNMKSLFIGVIIFLCMGSAADAKYSGGTGEPNDPYQIAIAEDLNDIGNHLEDFDKHFILVNDVNLADYTGMQFKIIGRWIYYYDPNNRPFVGVFDGNDNAIWNFTLNSDSRDCVGLFGYLGEGGVIKNLGLENVDINAVNGIWVGGLVVFNGGGTINNCYSTGMVSAATFVGGLVAENEEGTITNCYSLGSVSGENHVGGLVAENILGTLTDSYSRGSVSGSMMHVGGLVGYSYQGAITGCYSTSCVSAGEYVGGLIGSTDSSVIINSYSSGSVLGYRDVGGLVGTNYKEVITNCYSTGNISASEYVGGLVGFNNEAAGIDNCYSTGSVSGTGWFIGGLIGFHDPEGFVRDSFWDIETSGQPTSAGGIGKTTAEMKGMCTFTDAGWDFVEIWGIGENQTYPFLRTELAGDLSLDKKVDFVDLAIMAMHWLATNNP